MRTTRHLITVSRCRIVVLLGVALILAACPSLIGRGDPLQVEIGLQMWPWQYPSPVASVAGEGPYRLEFGLTHQRAANRSATRLSLLGLMTLSAEERFRRSITTVLGAGVEIGRITIGFRGSTSTTPMAALKLVIGTEHGLERPALTLYARVWHAIDLQPQGLGYGAALGVRVPLATLWGTLNPQLSKEAKGH